MLTYHHQFIMLISNLYQFSYQSLRRTLMVLFVLDGNSGFYRIPYKYRLEKTKTFITVCHRYFVDKISSKANSYCEDECTVCNSFLKGLCFAPFFVHVVREKVS